MKALRKRDLYILRAAIKGFAEEARNIRKTEIRPSSHEERARAWGRKRSLGLQARFHMLAYAFMLGKRYDEVEFNRPLHFNWWQTNTAIAEILAICKLYGDYNVRYGGKEMTAESVLHWFKTGENVVFRREEYELVYSTITMIEKKVKTANV